MPTTIKSPFKLGQVIVKEFNLKREPVKQGRTDFKIKPSGVIDETNKIFKLSLFVTLKDSTSSFDINFTALGFFEFKEVINESHLNNYFYTNAPAIVFPYLRAYISAVSALSGLKAINLPVMNLIGLKEELKANTVKDNGQLVQK